jgi:hypothetical protein
MELFIPSLFILLIAGLLAFLIIPRSTVSIVLGVSLLTLLYVLHDHYGKFYNEYRYSTWQYTAQGYAPYIIIGVLILFILTSSSFVLNPFGGQPQPMISLPTATTATNPITSVINSGIRAVNNTATAATAATLNTITAATNAVKNIAKNKNSGSAYNISTLLGSNK